jgi:hypothetical protein
MTMTMGRNTIGGELLRGFVERVENIGESGRGANTATLKE